MEMEPRCQHYAYCGISLPIYSTRKIGTPIEMLVTNSSMDSHPASGAEKILTSSSSAIILLLLQHFLRSRRSEFINTKRRYTILHVLVNIFFILIRCRGALYKGC